MSLPEYPARRTHGVARYKEVCILQGNRYQQCEISNKNRLMLTFDAGRLAREMVPASSWPQSLVTGVEMYDVGTEILANNQSVFYNHWHL